MNVEIRFDEREMVYQRVDVLNPDGTTKFFYVARDYGSRDLWIDETIFELPVRKKAHTAFGARRIVETTDGERVVIRADWITKHFKLSELMQEAFAGLENVFDEDNSRGQLKGKIAFGPLGGARP